MKIGKLKSNQLEKYVFKNLNSKRREVIVRGGTGIDTSVLDFENDLIVTSTDPITGATNNIGSLAINISVNDVCCQGADPVGVLLTILLPPESEFDDLEKIIKDCNKTCQKLNLEIIGGHTEVTDAVSKIILSTTVLGKVKRDKIPNKELINAGDVVAISKYIGLEGTSILYNDKCDSIKNLTLEEKSIALKLNELISVKQEALLAIDYKVKYMHDITEGGVYGAIWESSKAINKGLEIYKDNIPILELTEKISEYYQINPFKLISSGSMLMIFNPNDFTKFKKEANINGIKITEIGKVTNTNSANIIDGLDHIKLKDPEPDELYKIIL